MIHVCDRNKLVRKNGRLNNERYSVKEAMESIGMNGNGSFIFNDQTHYKFNSKKAGTRSIQILNYIKSHDGCTRKEIVKAIWNIDYRPGYACGIFSGMRNAYLIDFDKNFKYHLDVNGEKYLSSYNC